MKPIPEEKCSMQTVSVNEIFDIIRAGKWFRQSKIATHEDITLTARAIHKAMVRPSPSPEAHCLSCRASNFEGKCDCDCHSPEAKHGICTQCGYMTINEVCTKCEIQSSPEARVDWEKSLEVILEEEFCISLRMADYTEGVIDCAKKQAIQRIQAAFEKGREVR